MGIFNMKYLQPKEIESLPKMSEAKLAKLAELIKAIVAGKVIQMLYTGSVGWADMSSRSLEDFLYVFLHHQSGYDYRVKPEEEVSSMTSIHKEILSQNEQILNKLEKHQIQIDDLYKLLLWQCSYNLK